MVQADGPSTNLAQTVVAMITSNMARAGHPSRIIASGGGLPMTSIIMTDNLATIHLSEIDSVIGRLADLS